MTYTVTNTADSGAGSLRQTILDANAHAGLDYISFDIPGSGVHTIAPLTTLPNITDPVVIDGATQPGASCDAWPPTLMIELSGHQVTGSGHGIMLYTSNSLVHGLVIGDFAAGVLIDGGSYNQVSCNYIGLDPGGVEARPNTTGVWIGYGGHNIIGTNGDGVGDDTERNIITGNGFAFEIGGPGAEYNVIAGNFIGITAAGTPLVQTYTDGIKLADNAQYDRIGTNGDGVSDDLERNIISGLDGYGIAMYGANNAYNVVAGNFIGTDISGTIPIGNVTGVWVTSDAHHNRIGTDGNGNGFDSHEANVIAGNLEGIHLAGYVASIVIAGNFIGTDISNGLDLGNTYCGIAAAQRLSDLLVGTNYLNLAQIERQIIPRQTG